MTHEDIIEISGRTAISMMEMIARPKFTTPTSAKRLYGAIVDDWDSRGLLKRIYNDKGTRYKYETHQLDYLWGLFLFGQKNTTI